MPHPVARRQRSLSLLPLYVLLLALLAPAVNADSHHASHQTSLFNLISNADSLSAGMAQIALAQGSNIMQSEDSLTVHEGTYGCSLGTCAVNNAYVQIMFALKGMIGTVQCVNDQLGCVLDGESTYNIIHIQGTGLSTDILTLRGLKFYRGLNSRGGGIYERDAVVHLKYCFFSNCLAPLEGSGGTNNAGGGAIYSRSSILSIYGTSFDGNSAYASRGDDIMIKSGSATIYSTCKNAGWSALRGADLDYDGSLSGPKFSYTCVSNCEAGLFFDEDLSECTPCPGGTYGAIPGVCTPCEPGHASFAVGSNSTDTCVPCPAGSSAPEAGSTECTECKAGYVSTTVGAAKCQACPPATYNPNMGGDKQSACAGCPSSHTSPGASTSSDQCFSTETIWYNMFTLEDSNRMFAYHKRDAEFAAVYEGLPMSKPHSMIFVDSITILVTSQNNNQILEFKYDGKYVGVFATVNKPGGLIHLPHLNPPQIAVCSVESKKIVFLEVAAGLNGGNVQSSTGAIRSLNLPDSPTAVPQDLAPVAATNQVLIMASSTAGALRTVFLACVPGTACTTETKQLVSFIDGTPRVSTVSAFPDTYLIIASQSGVRKILACSLTSASPSINNACSVFAGKPADVESWEPTELIVDESRQLVFVMCDNTFAVYAFDYGGFVVASMSTPAAVTSAAFKPGIYGPLSRYSTILSPTTNEAISFPIELRDRFDKLVVLANSKGDVTYKNLGYEVDRLAITAEGTVRFSDTISFPLSVEGDVTIAADGTTVTATVEIKFKGDWTFAIEEKLELSSQRIGLSPFNLYVFEGPTTPESCKVNFDPTITAGDTFVAEIITFDANGNPTNHPGDNFSAELNGAVLPLTEKQSQGGHYTFSKKITKAGVYPFRIYSSESDASDLVGGSQFAFQVESGAPFMTKCEHSIGGKNGYFDPSAGKLKLQVVPFDSYNNLVTEALGFKVVIERSGSQEVDKEVIILSPPAYTHEVEFDKDASTSLTVTFKYNNQVLPNSPQTIVVARTETEADLTPVFVATPIVIFIIALICCKSWSEKKQARNQIQNMHLEMGQLQTLLREKSHTSEEIDVMRRALDDLSKERADELREVLIPSFELEVVRLLGKGGFGVVNLANYKGQQIAAKTLLNIEQESVQRFRFECFLMKNLRHPNIVRLVGVCWDNQMFACCLEFVENGSLEDHLRTCVGEKRGELTWKNKLLKTIQECAAGMQYLHQARYFSEEENRYKECIVHRDLKPDNMLLTNDWTLKLTDFGEARATDLNHTMTSVGTPIYMAPEVLSNDRYDFKADVYSYGICLVAMIGAEKNVVEFFFESLRKSQKKKSRIGMGITSLNNALMNKGWRPVLPSSFRNSYPKLCKLMNQCWLNDAALRPDFGDICSRVNGEIGDEIRAAKEPDVVRYAEEPDEVYWEADHSSEKVGKYVGRENVEAEKSFENDSSNNEEKTDLNEAKLGIVGKKELLEELVTLRQMKNAPIKPLQYGYVDSSGQEQGPFGARQMKAWNSSGAFVPGFRIRCEDNWRGVEEWNYDESDRLVEWRVEGEAAADYGLLPPPGIFEAHSSGEKRISEQKSRHKTVEGTLAGGNFFRKAENESSCPE
jgi:serine/threonine protein kinase